ncbi:hypothetical protein XccvBFoX4_gp14 [Xanthomonas phage FoX4]|uniref:Uncharacterized protein n=1 Tax=Xanthomonas phage FoX4 TaxID=2723900 RepID=A0A858WNZ0_9CAUD|nr:hypothetical protein KNU97_gp14 [Xanthomonas phage FoX4]QJI52968.1 hypothetical protein XccvBFoX4_gp14 [Xanthomonas phage FoX4]
MELLPRYEISVGLSPVDACRLLGVAYSTYNQYRRGQRSLPIYIALHVDLLMRLDQALLDQVVRDRLVPTEGEP